MRAESAPRELRVTLCGVGKVARNLTRLLSARSGVRIVAAFTRNPTMVGRDLGELSGLAPSGLAISAEGRDALNVPTDVVVVITTSFLKDVAPDIRAAISAGANVICTAEEMAYPWIVDAALADELDSLARAAGVTVLGAGGNPGLIFDALVLTLAGAAWDVESITVRRVVNLSQFSLTVLRRLGIGYGQSEFEAGAKGGTIYGHIGFPQSMHVVAERVGESIERIEKSISPILAEREYVAGGERVLVGQSAGFHQSATAYVGGRPWFIGEFTGHLAPEDAGFTTQDVFEIEGHNPVHASVRPGFRSQPLSAAVLANSLRRVVEAPPGLTTVGALPPAAPSPTDAAVLRS